MSKAKSVSKSIRLTEEVFTYIDGYQGEGFNQKFENIILDAMISESKRKKRIESLDQEIAKRENEFRKLFEDISAFQSLYRDVIWIARQIDDMRNRVSQMNAAAPAAAGESEVQE